MAISDDQVGAMRDDDRAAALQNFIEQLNELYQRAGPPKLSRLRQLSEQVVVNQGVTGLRVLAESTTSDILSGKRSRFPEWPWVASFVTACWMAATETAIDPGQLGSVEEWRVRFRKARNAAGEPVTGEAAATLATLATAADEPGAPRPPAPGEVTPAMRLLTNYKRTGGRLLRHAAAGDAEAAFRLAVLLLCGDRQLEATEWLRRASRAGHDDALELLHHPRQQIAAARHAYRIAHDYEAAGNLPAALAFLEQAADASPRSPARRSFDAYRNADGSQWQHDSEPTGERTEHADDTQRTQRTSDPEHTGDPTGDHGEDPAGDHAAGP